MRDKTVLITGSTAGIGMASARSLALLGSRVLLVGRNADRARQAAQRLRTDTGNPRIEAYCADVSCSEDLTRLAATVAQEHERLDVLINNAGVMPISPLDELRVEDWEEMVDVNLKGVLYGIAAALPVFRKQGSGHFVNTASTAGHRIVPNQSVYAGTKFAVRAISEGLRQEAGADLRVTIISPGMTRTNFADGVTDPAMRARLAEARDGFAMPPDAIARAVAFAIEQPADIDVGEVIVRPTAQA